MSKTMRDELLFFDGAFRAIMMTTKDMSIEDNTIFQYALDSIDYILKSENWLDDEWVKVGFENIVTAKNLLNKMLNEGDYTENTCLRHARDRLRIDGGVHPIEISLLTEEERKRADSLRKYARRAIDSHNQQEIHREAPSNHFKGLGGSGMKSLIRSERQTTTVANSISKGSSIGAIAGNGRRFGEVPEIEKEYPQQQKSYCFGRGGRGR